MPRQHAPIRPLSLATILLLAACAPRAGVEPVGSDPAVPDPTPTVSHRPTASLRPIATAPPPHQGVVGEVPDVILEPILADARERLNTDAVTVLVGAEVTWSDGALGCPEPGMMYTQALVDGFQVVVTDGTTELDYRVGSSGAFRLCTNDPPAGG